MYGGFFLVNLQKNSASNGTKFAFARILSRFEVLLVDYTTSN